MPTMNRLAAALLLALIANAAVATTAHAQSAPAAASADAAAFNLEADVLRSMRTFNVPGMAIAIVKDGKVVAARGFGVRKLGAPAPVDAGTLFEVASNSKAFTAVALAMLVDEGKLAWDDPVTKHLPDFQMFDAYVTHEMTVRDLLTHRSGLGLGAGDLLWWPTTTFSADEIIEKLRYIRPATSFRNSYAYDNLLYIAAGKIVASKAGKSWGEAVRERILVPVGMRTTTTSLAENASVANQSSPHANIDDRIAVVKPMPAPNGAGAVGINTNADDIARWMMVLLDAGKLPAGGADGKEQRLFSQARSSELWTAQTPIAIAEPKPALAATRPNFRAYGLGFELKDYRGVKLATHGGALQGFYSQVTLVPQAKLGIAIFTNAESSPAMTALQYRILDQYLDFAPTDWIGRYGDIAREAHDKELARLQSEAGKRVAKSQPSLALAAYDGDYADAWYGKVTIAAEGGKHIMRFSRTPDLNGTLEHFQHDTFIVRWKERNFNADAYVTFSLNPDGSIERVKMAPVSMETDFSFDFADLNLLPVKANKKTP